MPIEEFVYAVRDFRRDDFNELLEKIRYLVSNRDIDGMKKLLISQMEKKDKKEPFASFNTILIKIRLQDLSGETYVTDQEIVTISDYLFSAEYWGYYELLLFMNTIDTDTIATYPDVSPGVFGKCQYHFATIFRTVQIVGPFA